MQKSVGFYADHFKLLGDKTRLTMMSLLRERDICVCEFVDMLELSQPGISQHLRKLKGADLVTESRRGQWVYYSLNLADKPHIWDVLRHIPSQKALLAKIESTCGDGVPS